MFERVLGACMSTRELSGTLVATDGEDAARIAQKRGAVVLRDHTEPTRLCNIVDIALARLEAQGATHALVVMADLPLLSARDLEELWARLRIHDLVIAPDQQRRGTSALGIRLGLGLRTWFGHNDSMQRHWLEGTRMHGASYVLPNPRIAFDVDSPADLERFAVSQGRQKGLVGVLN